MEDESIVRRYAAGYSTCEIAKEFNTYPNRVRRILKRNGVEMRDKKEAQQNALENGKPHPTRGKKRTEEEKLNISESVALSWQLMDKNKKKEHSKKAKERWDAISESDKKEMRTKAGMALRATVQNGTKAELFLLDALTKAGFITIIHKEGLVEKQKSHVDLYLSEIRTVIEIDGPQHRRPVFGEEHLRSYIRHDTEKDGLLLGKGFNIIRVIYDCKFFSGVTQRELLRIVLDAINKVKDKSSQYIEVEINNGSII